METTYQVNGKSIAHETIDNEVVIVNLDNGAYFSMDDAGADVWSLLVQGASTDQIVDRMSAVYAADRTEIAASVAELIAQLADEMLIVPATAVANGEGPSLAKPTDRPIPYSAPILQKYTDMEDLLLLDPIHEVTEEGWPNAN